MELLLSAEKFISGILPFTILIICGLFLSFKFRFIQIRYFNKSLKIALGSGFKKKDQNNPFTAACTALSSTVGTGNISGVASALSLGGAGAVFWMWVSASVGMCVKVIEIFLALKYKEKRGNVLTGGPMYYIKNGLPAKFLPLAFCFSFAGILASFTSGNIVQVNSCINSFNESFNIKLFSGLLFCIITAFVIIGGNERIGKFAGKIVPFMALLYIFLSLGIIIINNKYILTSFKMIIIGAFRPKAVTGGIIGSIITTIVTGASKGVFSNEAGLGTSAMAHSTINNQDKKSQSLFGIFEVFIDTIVICTLTALVILCSNVDICYGEIASTELVQSAFYTQYGNFTFIILIIMMFLFAISSVIGWALYGSVCSEFIFGKKGRKIFIYIYPLFCIIGAFCNTELSWRMSALFNGLMLCINIPAVLLLSDNIKQDF